MARAKDDFVSNVSHELRTPITSIKLHHGLLKKNPTAYPKYMPTLEHETERLNALIEGLLLLSRLDQQRVVWQFAPVDLTELISSLVTDRLPLAEQRQITLAFTPVENMPILQGDRALIEQVASILLTNALNYTPPTGQVTVQTQRRDDAGKIWAGFCVQDNGPGITPEDQSRLFERFFRGKAACHSGQGGTGLGLAIAKSIIDEHVGRIEVQSPLQTTGGGTQFSVWLPAKAGG